jgi:hypothetical protein
MKNDILEIIQQHKLGHIPDEQAVKELCILFSVVSSCVDKATLIEDLNDKRIVGVTLDENMWHYCRKETAQHLLDKYEIKPK